MGREDLDLLRNALIPGTVQHAFARSAFYHEAYASIDLSKVATTSDLRVLPIMTKDQVRAAGHGFLCTGQTCSHVQNTSGSTGPPLLIYRSLEEMLFIQEFFKEVHSNPSALKAPRPIALSLSMPHHGTPTPVPCDVFMLTSGFTDDELVEHTMTLLNTRFQIRDTQEEISIIMGSHSQILALTDYMIEKGIAADGFGIRSIHLTGRYLTKRWRRVLGDTWKAQVIDHYSLSEIFGGATWCPHCHGYHFEPHVVAELVDLSGQEVLARGAGLLLLTSLYPFVQLQPFIRYFTGDIFRVEPDSCAAPRFEYLGRLDHALVDPDSKNRLLLTGVDVVEVLDEIPEIGRSRHFRDLRCIDDGSATGTPLVKGEIFQDSSRLHFVLKVELTVTPLLFPERARSLGSAIRNALISRSAALASDIAAGKAELSIHLVGPGALSPWIKKTVLWEKAAG